MTRSNGQEAMLCLIRRPIPLTTPVIFSFTSRGPTTFGLYSRKLLQITGFHLQSIWKGLGLTSLEDVVGRSKPHIDNLECFVAILVFDLIDGRIPVQRFVLLDIARVSWRVSQVFIRDTRPHCEEG